MSSFKTEHKERPVQLRASAPGFAAQGASPWDPLVGQQPPIGGGVRNPPGAPPLREGHKGDDPGSRIEGSALAADLAQMYGAGGTGALQPVQRKAGQAANPRPPIEVRHGLGVNDTFKLYDAELNRDTETLTLIVRIKFAFVPTDADQVWPDEKSKLKFISDFKRGVESRWSYRYFLVPEQACDEPVKKYKARVRVEAVDAQEHFDVAVKYVSGRKKESSSTNSTYRTAELHSDDNQPHDTITGHGKTSQSASEHEFGHMLGLDHVNQDAVEREHKTKGKRDIDPYGETREQEFNIMGYGHLITSENYIPFTTAMYYFTGCNWTVSQK